MCQAAYNVLTEQYTGGMPFKMDGGNFKDVFEQIHKGESTTEPTNSAPKEEVKQEKPTAKEKEKSKPAEKKKSPPSKVKRGKMWDISCYEDETLEFNEGDVDLSTFFMVTNCVKTNIIIHGKFNNIAATNCKNCAIIIDNVIASVEIIKGDEVKLQVNERAPQVTVDRSNKTGIYLNDKSKDIKVSSTTSTATYLHFPTLEKDINMNDEASMPIPETYITVIKNDKLITTPLDLTD
jgi:hypothetical protein